MSLKTVFFTLVVLTTTVVTVQADNFGRPEDLQYSWGGPYAFEMDVYKIIDLGSTQEKIHTVEYAQTGNNQEAGPGVTVYEFKLGAILYSVPGAEAMYGDVNLLVGSVRYHVDSVNFTFE